MSFNIYLVLCIGYYLFIILYLLSFSSLRRFCTYLHLLWLLLNIFNSTAITFFFVYFIHSWSSFRYSFTTINNIIPYFSCYSVRLLKYHFHILYVLYLLTENNPFILKRSKQQYKTPNSFSLSQFSMLLQQKKVQNISKDLSKTQCEPCLHLWSIFAKTVNG